MAPKKKQVIGTISLQVPAGQANPAPPVGPALGQKGLNIMDFCKAFNDASVKNFQHGTPIPVLITAYADRTFDFVMKTPPATWYLLNAAKKKKGATAPSFAKPEGSVTMAQCREIAEAKMADLSANDADAGAKIIAGSARSMGLAVKG